MSNDIFREVRERVSARSAAEFYGLQLDRSGRALCPFHDDHDPSMSFRGPWFRCWSCGASGSAIDLVMRLFGLDALGAVRQLNEDFNLGLPLDRPQTVAERRAAAQAAERRRELAETRALFEDWKHKTADQLSAVFRMAHLALLNIETPEDLDQLSPAEVAAIHHQFWAGDVLEALTSENMQEVMTIFRMRGEVSDVCRRILSHTPTSSGAA